LPVPSGGNKPATKENPPPPPPPHFSSVATRIGPKDMNFGDFAVSSPPSADHPKGTLVALGWGQWAEAAGHAGKTGKQPESGLLVVEIDLASTAPIGTLAMGAPERVRLLRADSGPVMAAQETNALDLVWLDGARAVRARHRVPQLGTGGGFQLAIFAAMGERLILVGADLDAGPVSSTSIFVLDNEGHIIARHKCHGGLGPQGENVSVEAWGDRAVIQLWDDPTPVCAFRLDRNARTIQATFPQPIWVETRGSELLLHFTSTGGLDLVQPLGDDLKPRGRAKPDTREDFDPLIVVEQARARGKPSRCSGITGTAIWQKQLVEGLLVVRTISCCGDTSPAGLFVCDPGPQAATADGGT
jgi:hypothetical protein